MPLPEPSSSIAPSPQQALGVGDWQEILPQYEVLDFIGRGGMGAV